MDEDLAASKIEVKKLTLKCPEEGPMPDCPLLDFRDLPLPERLSAVDDMDREQLLEILRYHQECQGRRNR